MADTSGYPRWAYYVILCIGSLLAFVSVLFFQIGFYILAAATGAASFAMININERKAIAGKGTR